MDMTKLTAFVDLAATLSYTRTAANLYTSQATISKQIKHLENELGVALFDRRHRRVALTAAGTAALAPAKRILAANRDLLTAVASVQHAHQTTLTIHAIPTIVQYRAFNLLPAFSKAHPAVQLHFAEVENDVLLADLKAKRADIVFMRLFAPLPATMITILGERDEFVAVLPANHPLAAAAAVTVQQLAAEHFLLLAGVASTYAPLLALFKDAKVTPAITYEGRRVDLILDMVERGMGVSIMMRQSFDLSDHPAIVAVPLRPQRTSRLAFVRLATKPSPAAAAFWDYAQAHRPQP